ncbi:hypothetical protein BDQ12DRAFT_717417 [Crucibulum laeve]|uniref:Uncharacterized protein n=1 Tax=Crucibulum laeve TaxID=68775 RepID=A0A5C3MFV2_9AGAR|nr:hypothetical protein BDQ12DRAFT_717417 [Crucibulum laeve]
MKDLSFSLIGNPEEDDNGLLKVRPMLPSFGGVRAEADVTKKWELAGSYTTVHSYLIATIAVGFNNKYIDLGDHSYSRTCMLEAFPSETFDGPPFGGYAQYPSWITRDWDPLVYEYPNGAYGWQVKADEDPGTSGEDSELDTRNKESDTGDETDMNLFHTYPSSSPSLTLLYISVSPHTLTPPREELS